MRRFSGWLPLAALLLAVLSACGDAGERVAIVSPTSDPCVDAPDPELLLSCPRFWQPFYWLGEELEVPGRVSLALVSSYIDDGEEPISDRTRLVLGYGPKGQRPGGDALWLFLWFRPAWEDYVGQFTGYDPATVPAEGPVNWWQHPCVEAEVYQADNGAKVHLFRAHLDSLIYILPMSPEEVATCRSRPVGVTGAHIYFDRTVIQLEFSTQAGNLYDNEETVRYLAASLRPYRSQ